ncbi:hypothetical protein [Variovorax boronicumulans]|uniref:hypothetical protein n=1 Tax=Variovorax boronicumulans TaxID=436515 RepID=UPI0012E5C666|nr:hypothetical protein [Variovorax boronicumulans]GER21354.1 hypothetical protein VCH24_64060 [Variovorax boronicumulans]
MVIRWRFVAMTVLLLTAAGAGAQQVFRLDDSTSPRNQIEARIEDSPLVARQGPTMQVRFGRIEYRLATAAHMGRRARIFYVVPPLINGLRAPVGMQVHWRDGRLFADGSARPGERRPVWNGVVREAWMNDSLDMSLELDARQLRVLPGADLGFEAYFEIEVLP